MKKPKIHNLYNNVVEPSTSGTGIIDVYELVNGNPIKVAERDLYAEIQEASVGSTLNEIIEKYKGQEIPIQYLNQRELVYGDSTFWPESSVELANLNKLMVDNPDLANKLALILEDYLDDKPEPEKKPDQPKPEIKKTEENNNGNKETKPNT